MRRLMKKPALRYFSVEVEDCTNLPDLRCLDSKISQGGLIHFLALRSPSEIVMEVSLLITAYDEGNKACELKSCC
jgi:hypothetical protein